MCLLNLVQCISLRLESRLTFITMCTYALHKDKYILVEDSSIQLGKDTSCCKKHAILFSHGILFHEKGRKGD